MWTETQSGPFSEVDVSACTPSDYTHPAEAGSSKCYCGSGGIRTHGSSHYAGFQDQSLRPLSHTPKLDGLRFILHLLPPGSGEYCLSLLDRFAWLLTVSIRRPLDFQSSALPTELKSQALFVSRTNSLGFLSLPTRIPLNAETVSMHVGSVV